MLWFVCWGGLLFPVGLPEMVNQEGQQRLWKVFAEIVDDASCAGISGSNQVRIEVKQYSSCGGVSLPDIIPFQQEKYFPRSGKFRDGGKSVAIFWLAPARSPDVFWKVVKDGGYSHYGKEFDLFRNVGSDRLKNKNNH